MQQQAVTGRSWWTLTCALVKLQSSSSAEALAAALGAVSEKARSQAAKREELLAKMLQLSPPLEEGMAGSALQVMEAYKKRGLILRLHSIVDDGGSSVVISATAEQRINRDVPAGTDLALKMMTSLPREKRVLGA